MTTFFSSKNESNRGEALQPDAAFRSPTQVDPADPAWSKWEKAALEIGALVTEKQAAYGNSFGKSGRIMRELYPAGIPAEKLDDALTIVRVVDKLFRIATKKDAFGENPWKDIAGYALLSVVRGDAGPAPAAPLVTMFYTHLQCDTCAARMISTAGGVDNKIWKLHEAACGGKWGEAK